MGLMQAPVQSHGSQHLLIKVHRNRCAIRIQKVRQGSLHMTTKVESVQTVALSVALRLSVDTAGETTANVYSPRYKAAGTISGKGSSLVGVSLHRWIWLCSLPVAIGMHGRVRK